jgi:hypothetical protein
MAKLPSTYAVDSGKKLSNGLNDIVWMSTEGVVPERRWFFTGEDLPKGESEPKLWGYGSVDTDGRLVVHYCREEVFGPLEEAPNLWFVLVDGRNKLPEQMSLFGFWDNSYPMGTIVSENEALENLGVDHLKGWAGMISWFVGDPVIQQVMTSPKYRRKRVSIMMFGVCDVVNACYGLSPGRVLHGGAVTTEDGEKLRNIYPQSSRIDKRIGSFKPGS